MKRLIILIAFSGLLLTGGMAQEANKTVRNKEQQKTHQEVKSPSQQQVEPAQNQHRYENTNGNQSGDQNLQKKQQKQQQTQLKKEEGSTNKNSYRSTERRSNVAAARSHNAQGAARKAAQANKSSKGNR